MALGMATDSNRDSEERDVDMCEFYGFTGRMFCNEVHAILHNEFLAAVRIMKEKMEKRYPDKSEEIHKCFTSLLISYSTHLMKQMNMFSQYFHKNYKIPAGINLYGMDVAESIGSRDKVIELRQKIIATQELNKRLKEKILQTKEKIVAREELKSKICQQLLKIKEIQEIKQNVDILRQELLSLTSNDSQ